MANNDLTQDISDIHAREGGLISVLEEVQAKYSYLPEDVLRDISRDTGIPLVDIYGVATFYKAFSLKPRGRHLISVCLGTACHVRGGPDIAREIEHQLDIKAGETTPDREFTLETVNCLGACAVGPVVVVDGHYFANAKISDVSRILEHSREGLDRVTVETDQRLFPVEVGCSRCNHSLMDPEFTLDGYPPIKVTVSFGNKHGWLILSSLWGSYNVQSQYTIPEDTVVQMFCPHCHAELIGAVECADCGAPMVPMIVKGGGVVQICSRRGCHGHLLDLGEGGMD
jgi:NADH-quinone oxidoreductase subunit E